MFIYFFVMRVLDATLFECFVSETLQIIHEWLNSSLAYVYSDIIVSAEIPEEELARNLDIPAQNSLLSQASAKPKHSDWFSPNVEYTVHKQIPLPDYVSLLPHQIE